MSQTSTITPRDYGLSPGAMRVRKVRPRTGRLTMPGWFPTRKGTHRALRVETQLEAAGLPHFETNPDCVLMATQPHHLEYAEPQPDGTAVWRRYTPDLAVLMADGGVVVIDFKPERFAVSTAWRRKEAILRHAYLRDHGIAFRTITEASLAIEPRRANVGIMMMHRRIMPDPHADVAIAAAIQRLGLPTTIGALSAAVDLPSEQPHANRALTAIVELAVRGGIALDLGTPLGPGTAVSARAPIARGGR